MKYKPVINFVFLFTTEIIWRHHFWPKWYRQAVTGTFFTSGRDWAGFALVSGIDEIFVIAGIGNFVAAF